MPSELTFTVKQDAGDSGFYAHASFAEGTATFDVFTEGDTFDELRDMVMDAVALTFEDLEPPTTIRYEFVEPFRAPAPRLP